MMHLATVTRVNEYWVWRIYGERKKEFSWHFAQHPVVKTQIANIENKKHVQEKWCHTQRLQQLHLDNTSAPTLCTETNHKWKQIISIKSQSKTDSSISTIISTCTQFNIISGIPIMEPTTFLLPKYLVCPSFPI